MLDANIVQLPMSLQGILPASFLCTLPGTPGNPVLFTVPLYAANTTTNPLGQFTFFRTDDGWIRMTAIVTCPWQVGPRVQGPRSRVQGSG